MVDIEVKAKRDNALLGRTEVEFVLHHPGETTPKRDQVREIVAKNLKGKKENVIVERLESEYGRAASRGYAKLYASAEAAKAVEPEHLLIRNGLAQKKKEE